MTTEAYGNDIRQLTVDELDSVAGGVAPSNWVSDTVAQVRAIVYPTVELTVGPCTITPTPSN
jgi:hypothetical protein